MGASRLDSDVRCMGQYLSYRTTTSACAPSLGSTCRWESINGCTQPKYISIARACNSRPLEILRLKTDSKMLLGNRSFTFIYRPLRHESGGRASRPLRQPPANPSGNLTYANEAECVKIFYSGTVWFENSSSGNPRRAVTSGVERRHDQDSQIWPRTNGTSALKLKGQTATRKQERHSKSS